METYQQYVVVISQKRGDSPVKIFKNDSGTDIDTGSMSEPVSNGTFPTAYQDELPEQNGTFTISIAEP